MELTRVFIHGLESSSRGTKGGFFRERYPGMIVEDFAGTFDQRMVRLDQILGKKSDLILVGSSYGGLMAAVYGCLHEDRVRKLVLLAPALHLEPLRPFLARRLKIPVFIFHGSRDDVVPLPAVRTVAGQLFETCTFTTVDDDHQLHTTFTALNWDTLLELEEVSNQ